MLMNLAMGGVNHQPFKVRLVNEDLKQLLPNALVAPATKATEATAAMMATTHLTTWHVLS